jgi:F-type H+-transporting ATPase subunit delta
MAELATIARPYAEALFKACSTDLTSALDWVNELGVIAENEDLQQFADNPKVTSAQVFDLIVAVVKSNLPDRAKNFLRTVVENKRLSVLPEIAAQFRSLKNTQSGSSDAVIYSAFSIDGDALAEVASMLEKRFGRRLNASVVMQPELIGGIRVVVGDEVLDTSVKARLEQMKVVLTA